jgi:uncharacterized small protein (DUF1192 family)
MPSTDYIPRNDEAFRSYAETFASTLVANYALYMVTPTQAALVQSLVDDFVAKLAITSAEATRTKGTIAAKDDARSMAESLIRQYAIDIKNNEGVTDENKINLGVRPINPSREPVDCPQSSPLVSVLYNIPGVQTLRYADTNTPDSASKPFGATEIQIWLGITEDGEATLEESEFYGKFTRNPIDIAFDESQDGKNATYRARWASLRGDVGPWSVPVSFRIAA